MSAKSVNDCPTLKKTDTLKNLISLKKIVGSNFELNSPPPIPMRMIGGGVLCGW